MTEGLGTPSQKTSLLGGVAQILINPRPSPRLADVGLFVRPKSQQSPLEQRVSPLQAQLSSHRKIKCSIEIQLFTAWEGGTPYVKTNCSRSLLYTACPAPRPLQRSTTAKFLESQTLASQGLIAPFAPVGWAGPLRLCAIGGIYIVEHHPHTRLSSGHGSDTT